MSNTLLQVKRSVTTAIPASLANGELAYSGNSSSNSLFIGHPDGSTGVIRIAGGKYPFLHQTTVGTLTANAAVITDANAFVSNVFTTGLFIASSIATPVANATAATITSITPQANTTQLGSSGTGSNTELVTSYAIKTYVDGKVTTATINTAAQFTFTNTISFSANVNIAGNTTSVLNIGTGVDANISANATTILFNANTAANGSITATLYSGTANNANNLGGTSLATLQGQITGNAATAYSNAVSNAAALYQTTAGLSANVLTLTSNNTNNLGGTSLATLQGQITGNAATAYSNATTFSSNASNLSNGTLPFAQLTSNVVIWSNNNIFTGIQTFDNIVINGNTQVGNATSDVVTFTARANSNIIPAANVTHDLGSSLLAWRDIFAGNGKFDTATTAGNLTVGGNLVVTGNLITQNVSSLLISDPLIYLAGNNTVSDAVDIGFAANYSNGSANFQTGLIRKNSTDNYYLFAGSTQDLTTNNIVNTGAIGFRNATLYSHLNSGALSSGNTALSITANASISVSITANTLALSTALPAASGGTGNASYANGDILYASNSTSLSKLTLGAGGTVLQVQGTTLAWASLDGGTF